MRNEDKLDALIRASLQKEEMPPAALQASIIEKIRQNKKEQGIPWWLPPVVGGMQTASFVAAVHILVPGSLFACLAVPAGGSLMICAGLLSLFAYKDEMQKERECIWG